MDDPTPQMVSFPEKNSERNPPAKGDPLGCGWTHQPLRASIYHLLSGHLQNPKKFIGLSEFIWVYLPAKGTYLSLSTCPHIYLVSSWIWTDLV